MRLHALPADSSVDLWLGGGLAYLRIREESRPGLDVGAGADFPFGDDGFALGSFVRYTQVIQPGGSAADARDDDRFLQLGAALSWGGSPRPQRALVDDYSPAPDLTPRPVEASTLTEEPEAVALVPEAAPEVAPEPVRDPAVVAESPAPDSDGDGIADADDDCRDEIGSAEERGCPPARAATPPPSAVGPLRTPQGELPTRIAFAYGAKRVTARGARDLREVLQLLKRDASIRKLLVVGHTDARGASDVNLALSEARAQAVVDWLVAHGVDAGRLEAAGRGAGEPRVEGQTKAAWRANRRVQFIVTETDAQP